MKKNAFITPDFFSVAPELLGLPLASPGRRAFAMAIDGVLVAILVQAGGVFFALAAVFVLLRASRSSAREGYVRKSVRFTLRATAAIVLFVAIVQGTRSLEDRMDGEKEEDEIAATTDGTSQVGNLKLDFSGGDAINVAAAVAGLASADDPEDVKTYGEKILFAAKRAGASDDDIRGSRADLLGLLGDDASPEDVAALDSAIVAVAGTAPPTVTPEDSLRSRIASLDREVARLDTRNNRLEEQLAEARASHGVRTYIAGLFDDLGLGFGWAAVYFTGFLAMMKGQTPGKRLAGVRVIRLDGKPLGWWIAFERFGGYAASFSVGLLGFFQILWDRNRQGLHDKACETVVVRRDQNAARS